MARNRKNRLRFFGFDAIGALPGIFVGAPG